MCFYLTSHLAAKGAPSADNNHCVAGSSGVRRTGRTALFVMAASTYKVGVVGATGAVGIEMVKVDGILPKMM